MARPSQPEAVSRSQATRRDARRESWTRPAENTEQEWQFNREILLLQNEEQMNEWIAQHGVKDLLKFVHSAIREHDNAITTHNQMVEMVEEANAISTQFGETIEQQSTTITRLETAVSVLQ